MKKRITILFALMAISYTGFCKIWTVTNSGISFSPSVLTITEGDTVKFVLTNSHDAREVSLSTWNLDENTPLNGGFQTNFGGGLVLPTMLQAGTHYYVCTPHAAFGMKAQIIVNKATTTAIEDDVLISSFKVSPNPSSGVFEFLVNNSNISLNSVVEVYNLSGELVFQTDVVNDKVDIDLSTQPDGLYLLELHNGETVLKKKIIKK